MPPCFALQQATSHHRHVLYRLDVESVGLIRQASMISRKGERLLCSGRGATEKAAECANIHGLFKFLEFELWPPLALYQRWRAFPFFCPSPSERSSSITSNHQSYCGCADAASAFHLAHSIDVLLYTNRFDAAEESQMEDCRNSPLEAASATVKGSELQERWRLICAVHLFQDRRTGLSRYIGCSSTHKRTPYLSVTIITTDM